MLSTAMNRSSVLWLAALLLLLSVALGSRTGEDEQRIGPFQPAAFSSAREQPPAQSDTDLMRARFAQKGFFKSLGNGLKKVGGALWNGAKALLGNRNSNVATEELKLGPIWQPMSPFHFRKTDIEDCVACQYVWYLIELEVGDDTIEENVYDAFTQICIDSQKAPIFYPACEHMFDQVYDMIGDYMDGKLNVNQMCIAAGFCRDPNPPHEPVKRKSLPLTPAPSPSIIPPPPLFPDPTPDDGGGGGGGGGGSGGKKGGKKGGKRGGKKGGKKGGKRGGGKSAKKGGSKSKKHSKKHTNKKDKKKGNKQPPKKVVDKIKKAFKTSVHFQNGFEKYRLFDYPTKTNKDVDGKPNPAGFKEEQKAFPNEFSKFKKLYQAGGGKVDATTKLEFHLGGYASKLGNAQKNMVLSLNRARAVACYLNGYLQKKDVINFTFRIGYFGESKSSGSTPAGQARDRRVDIFFRENTPLKKIFREKLVWKSGSKNMNDYCSNRSRWQNKKWQDNYLKL